ncbi:MAG: DUF1080 domain-containing protein [Ruminococcaceae bacterium]|nr:DUF1080 domain-containing protein [Oscillospiraceae bacterium]
MKKLLLYILVILNLFGIQVAAENNLSKQSSAAQELCELGILQGDENGNLKTEDNVTRAELAALLVRIIKAEIPDIQTKFSDVGENHWAKDYINAIQEKGYINGYPDGSFCPDKNVLFEEAASVLVNVLGYDKKAKSYGGYPWGTLLTAAEVGITHSLDVVRGEVLTRGELSQMLLNSMYILPGEGADEKSVLIDIACPDVFFVSPDGSDENNGSYLSPWKSFKKATETLKAGQSVIFEDGKYIETKNACVNADICIKSRNKHGAVIIFPKSEQEHITFLQGSSNVSIKNFDFSENSDDTPLIKGNVNAFNLVGNKIKSKIVLDNSQNLFIEDNSFINSQANITNCKEVVFKGNEFKNSSDYSVYVDAATKDLMICNNLFTNDSETIEAALLLGKESKDEFAVSHCAIWNNVISCVKDGETKNGISLNGVKNSRIFNNVICGAATGMSFNSPTNSNIILRNNIFAKSDADAYRFNKSVSSFSSDYNLFYEAYPETEEKHSKFGLPEFINDESNWRIIAHSPAVHSGEIIKKEFIGFDGKVYELELFDADGCVAGTNPNMGAFQCVKNPDEKETFEISGSLSRFTPKGKSLLTEDFSKIEQENWSERLGDWMIEGGMLKQTVWGENRCVFIYNGGSNWSDYAVSADIKAPSSSNDKNVGLIFRLTDNGKEGYTLRTSGKAFQFAKWINNSLQVIETWSYPIEDNEYYNFGIEAKGSRFTFYINGEKIGEAEDSTHSIGTVALYSFRDASVFDNLKVAQIQ